MAVSTKIQAHLQDKRPLKKQTITAQREEPSLLTIFGKQKKCPVDLGSPTHAAWYLHLLGTILPAVIIPNQPGHLDETKHHKRSADKGLGTVGCKLGATRCAHVASRRVACAGAQPGKGRGPTKAEGGARGRGTTPVLGLVPTKQGHQGALVTPPFPLGVSPHKSDKKRRSNAKPDRQGATLRTRSGSRRGRRTGQRARGLSGGRAGWLPRGRPSPAPPGRLLPAGSGCQPRSAPGRGQASAEVNWDIQSPAVTPSKRRPATGSAAGLFTYLGWGFTFQAIFAPGRAPPPTTVGP